MKTLNYKKEILKVLKDLIEEYPNQLVSTHLSIALSDFPKFDSVSDKELFFILEKYKCEKELDLTPLISQSEIDELYKDFELTADNLEDEEEY